MQDFRGLKVWEAAHELTLGVYRATATFPREELFGLTRQLRRAAVSIGSNLAEGCGRHSQAELAQFAQIAMGSASETEYQLLLARDLGYLPPQGYEVLNQTVVATKKMLASLIQRVRSATEN